jgi:hypothetical protein
MPKPVKKNWTQRGINRTHTHTTPGLDKTGSGFFMSSSQDNPGGITHASKMNACATKDRNVVGCQNDTPPESPKAAAKKSEGFQPGEEWEGSAGPGRGNKVRGQNDPVVKKSETAKTTALILLNPDHSCDK